MADLLSDHKASQWPTRGDRLLEELKSSRPRPTQFPLAGLLGMTLLVAILFAIARASGSPRDFFAGLYLLLFGCTPLAAWGIGGLLPGFSQHARKQITLLLAILIALPLPIALTITMGPGFALGTFATVALLLWLPQVLISVTIARLLFRD